MAKVEEMQVANGRTLRAVVLPTLAPVVSLGAAIAGALATGTGQGAVTGGVEFLSSSGSTTLGDIGLFLPLGFAFAAGMVSAVNPCGFAMLPAYLGLYLGTADASKDGAASRRALARRLGQALLLGATVTLGFVVLFGVAGVAIGTGAQFLVNGLAWIGLAIGILLTLAGAWMLRGGTLYSGLGERVAARIGDPSQSNVRGYFLFGISYGTASLSCTLPIFLTVIGGSIVVGSLLTSVGQFILYGLGMGLVILALTISVALFRSAFARLLQRALPYIHTTSAVMLLAAGGYIVYYWLTLGRLLDTFA